MTAFSEFKFIPFSNGICIVRQEDNKFVCNSQDMVEAYCEDTFGSKNFFLDYEKFGLCESCCDKLSEDEINDIKKWITYQSI